MLAAALDPSISPFFYLLVGLCDCLCMCVHDLCIGNYRCLSLFPRRSIRVWINPSVCVALCSAMSVCVVRGQRDWRKLEAHPLRMGVGQPLPSVVWTCVCCVDLRCLSCLASVCVCVC